MCDERCWDADSNSCDCDCNGRNHGTKRDPGASGSSRIAAAMRTPKNISGPITYLTDMYRASEMTRAENYLDELRSSGYSEGQINEIRTLARQNFERTHGDIVVSPHNPLEQRFIVVAESQGLKVVRVKGRLEAVIPGGKSTWENFYSALDKAGIYVGDSGGQANGPGIAYPVSSLDNDYGHALQQEINSAEKVKQAYAKRTPIGATVLDSGDSIAARELQLYIENDSSLYRSRYVAIRNNLNRKKKNGTYDREKAVKAFQYLADEGARKYNGEFGGKRTVGSFDKSTRTEVAKGLRDFYESDTEA